MPAKEDAEVTEHAALKVFLISMAATALVVCAIVAAAVLRSVC